MNDASKGFTFAIISAVLTVSGLFLYSTTEFRDRYNENTAFAIFMMGLVAIALAVAGIIFCKKAAGKSALSGPGIIISVIGIIGAGIVSVMGLMESWLV